MNGPVEESAVGLWSLVFYPLDPFEPTLLNPIKPYQGTEISGNTNVFGRKKAIRIGRPMHVSQCISHELSGLGDQEQGMRNEESRMSK